MEAVQGFKTIDDKFFPSEKEALEHESELEFLNEYKKFPDCELLRTESRSTIINGTTLFKFIMKNHLMFRKLLQMKEK